MNEPKPLIYIASPYTKGDPAINVAFQMDVFHRMLDDGLATPYVPLLSHFLHIYQPREYSDWMRHDFEILHKCDAVVRLMSRYEPLDYVEDKSMGADAEEDYALEIGIPVFKSLDEVYAWLPSWVAGRVC